MKFVITGMGVVSAGGYSPEQTYATVRAGLTPLAESEEFSVRDEHGMRQPVVCGAAIGISDGQRRFLRHLRLARFALEQALAQAAGDARWLQGTHMHLCLQEPFRPGMDDRPQQILADYLARDLNLGSLASRSRAISAGHAGLYWSLAAAMQQIAGGACHAVVIGAVDTYLDDLTLDWLFDTMRLKTPGRARGFIPAEAAGFIVLETQASAARRGVEPLVELLAPATAMEENSLYEEAPCKGDGLSECLRTTLAALEDGGTGTGMVVCDLNGERYRAAEWGFALPRAMGALTDEYEIVHPADCIGDAGAASAAINVCFAAVAIREGVVRNGRALLWGSSDDGERGSVHMRAA